MEPLKTCNLCGTTSNDTAIFSCAYAKGNLEICLECLTEGIMEITRNQKPKQELNIRKTDTISLEPFELEEFNVSEEVFGFSCEQCGSVLFTSGFPVTCQCGHLNHESVLKKDLMNYKD